MRFFSKPSTSSQPDEATVARIPVNPSVLLAGCVPLGLAKSPLEPAWHALANSFAFGTDNVRFVSHVFAGKVFYVGAMEQDFDGAGVYTTRLRAALPGSPFFKGDGAYFDTNAATPAMLMVKGETLSARVGTRESLERLARAESLPLYDLDETHTSNWETLDGLAARAIWKRVRVTTWVGVGAYVLGSLFCGYSLWSLASARSQVNSSEQAVQMLRNQLTTELGRSVGNPLAGQLKQLQRVQSVALDNKGTLHYWKFDSKGVSFKLSLPPYVRSDDYQSLGPLTSVENVDGAIVLLRGEGAKK